MKIRLCYTPKQFELISSRISSPDISSHLNNKILLRHKASSLLPCNPCTPTITKHINIHFPESIEIALRNEANESGESLSSYIRRMFLDPLLLD